MTRSSDMEANLTAQRGSSKVRPKECDERWLLAATQAIPVLLAVTDDQGRLLAYNAEAVRVAERVASDAETTGSSSHLGSVSELVPQVARSQVSEVISKAFERGEAELVVEGNEDHEPVGATRFGFRRFELDQGQVGVAVWADATRDRYAAAHIRRMMAARVESRTERLRELNAALRAEVARSDALKRELRRSQRLFKEILDNTRALIYAKDAEGRYLLANRYAAELIGQSPEGMTDEELLPIDAVASLVAHDREVLRTGQAREFEEVISPGGEERTYVSSKFPLRDAQGNVYGVGAVSTDITDRKRAEHELSVKAAELARSNRDLEQFASLASHDLQEPLRAVAGACQLLQRGYADQLDEHGRELIEMAVSGAKRMRQFVQGLLEYSRVQTRGGALECVPARDVLEEALANLRESIRERGAKISVGELPVVKVDRRQMAAFFQNLIGNAIKYVPPETVPEVRIEARTEGDEHVFSVSDNGIGIEPDMADKVFDLFGRLHPREYPGTGIGLAVCQRIIERHGGRIWLESKPGEGTTFYFTLPAEPGACS